MVVPIKCVNVCLVLKRGQSLASAMESSCYFCLFVYNLCIRTVDVRQSNLCVLLGEAYRDPWLRASRGGGAGGPWATGRQSQHGPPCPGVLCDLQGPSSSVIPGFLGVAPVHPPSPVFSPKQGPRMPFISAPFQRWSCGDRSAEGGWWGGHSGSQAWRN